MDLADVQRCISSVYGKKDGILRRMSIRMPFYLSLTFCGTFNVSFRQVTRGRLRCYGQYLYECGLKPNTVSTYMRMLRSIYNRGVESGECPLCAPIISRCLYRGGYPAKKALPVAELHRLFV